MRVTGAADPRRLFKDTLPGKLPQRVFVFGISALPPRYVEALLALGSRPEVEVHLFVTNPCRYYWGDLLDRKTLAQWADGIHVSERTLARQFLKELGMSFGQWRQRLRFVASIEALDSTRSIQEIAFDMGYSTASAFIAMFQRQAGCTPEYYRRYKVL